MPLAESSQATIVMGKPLMHLATGSFSSFSRTPPIKTMASVKPMPAQDAYKSAKPRFMEMPASMLETTPERSFTRSSSATPRMAQLVVRGAGRFPRAIEGRGKFLNDLFQHLYESRNDKDEEDNLKVFDFQRYHDIEVERPGDERCKNHNQGDSDTHGEGAVDLFRDGRGRDRCQGTSQG